MPLRVAVILSVLAGLNIYLACRLMARWPAAAQHPYAVWGLTLGFYILQIAAPLADRLLFQGHKAAGGIALRAFDWLSYLALGVMSCAFFYTVLADAVGIVWRILALPSSTTDFERRALITLGAATAATTVLGVAQAEAGPAVRKVEIPLKNLPASFDGFTIAQISDLHVGPMIDRAYAQNVVDITNGLKPDLIALTGDFVDGSVDDLSEHVAPLAELHAPHGKYYITGNHEYYSGVEAWIEKFKSLGARVLLNEHEVIRRGDGAVVLAGVTDYSTRTMPAPHACNVDQSVAGAPQGLIKILLAHQPATYKMAHAAGVDLQLSGHTHAGQYFPFSMFIGLVQRYYKGLNRHEAMWVYVNVGTGFWGPPLRTALPSEITLITLRREVA